MKKILPLLLCFGFFAQISFAQVGINATGTAPATPAMLDVSSTNKGLLIPRVALSASNSNVPIGANIVTSLLVYNTATAGTSPNNVVPGYYYWNGTAWVALVGSAFTLPYSGMISSGANALDINNTVGRAAYFQSPNSSETMRVYNSGTGNAITVDGNLNVTGDLKTNGVTGTVGQVLRSNGNGTMSWSSTASSLTNTYPKSLSYNGLFDNISGSQSTYSFTVPSGITKIWVEAWGGGSAGALLPTTMTNTTASKGGDAGSFLSVILNVVPSEVLTINVGNGSSVSSGGASTILRNSTSSSILEVGGGTSFSFYLPTDVATNTNGLLCFVKGEIGHVSTESYSQTSSTNFVRTVSGGSGGSAYPDQKGGSGTTVTYNLSNNTMFSNFGVAGNGTIPGGGGGVGYTGTGGGSGGPGMIILHW
jgi:hypothetical protein